MTYINKNYNTIDLNDDKYGGNNMKILGKKQFKKLGGDAKKYQEYKAMGEIAQDALDFGYKSKKELSEVKAEIPRLESELKAENERHEAELKAENERHEAELKAKDEQIEELEAKTNKGLGYADAAIELGNKAIEMVEASKSRICAEYEIYDDCGDELSAKARIINRFRKNIKDEQKIIAEAKHDIKLGVAINYNKKVIRDSEAQIRYYQEQINGAQKTMNNFKNKKTEVSERIATKRTRLEEFETAWNIVKTAMDNGEC